jgi:hypothetical protein
MMNGDADITISEGDSSWQFSVPVMNLVDSLVTASEKLSDSNQLVEFKDWDSSFTISFVLAGNTVLIESDGTKRFHTPILEFKSAVAEFSERVKIDLETRYPDLIKNKAFQRFFLRGQNEN